MADEYWEEIDPTWSVIGWSFGFVCLIVALIQWYADWFNAVAAGTLAALYFVQAVMWNVKAKFTWSAWVWDRRTIIGMPYLALAAVVSMTLDKLISVTLIN